MGITIATAFYERQQKPTTSSQQTITASLLLFPVGKIPEQGGSYT
jgi:hypothetical protein